MLLIDIIISDAMLAYVLHRFC